MLRGGPVCPLWLAFPGHDMKTLEQAGRKDATIAIVIPAFNECATVGETILGFHMALPGAGIYVIDNNSTDGTATIASRVLCELPCSSAVIREERQGKGFAVRRAFAEIDADVYLLVDADLTYPASRACDLVQPVVNGDADMVVGDRHSLGGYAKENRRQLHGLGNRLVRQIINSLFAAHLTDIMSGYRVMSRQFVKNYPILVGGFQLETDMTLHALHKRFRIVEIPVEYRDRPTHSVSKLNTLSDGARVLFTIAQILRYYRPLAFFGVIGMLVLLAGIAAGVPVVSEFVRSRFVSHVPLAILASGLGISGLMMLAIGLILDSLVHQSRFDYERELLQQSANRQREDTRSAVRAVNR